VVVFLFLPKRKQANCRRSQGWEGRPRQARAWSEMTPIEPSLLLFAKSARHGSLPGAGLFAVLELFDEVFIGQQQ
jgi:hypothetical protein